MITFQPKQATSIIKVIGVGGGGSNAVNHMFTQGITGVDFVVCNTDVQALQDSPVPVKIEIGNNGGLGAGSKPDVGRNAATESIDKIQEVLSENTQMLFVTAGMGGGTGTGAAPIIAKLSKEMGILTVGIVTLPFQWEGRRRSLQALAGVEEMKKYVDTLLVINNDKLRMQYGNLSVKEAFAKADNVLTIAAKGIAEIITATGKVNTDFEDVKTVIKDSGNAIMGQATAEGDDRAMSAIEEAMNSPLLNDNDINGATNILLHIVSGSDDITMDEISEITEYVQSESGHAADVIWGLGEDESLGDSIGITVIATGFDKPKTEIQESSVPKTTHTLYDGKKNKVAEKPITETKNVSNVISKPVEKTPDSDIINDFISDHSEKESEIKLINRPIVKDGIKPENRIEAPRVIHKLGDDDNQKSEEEDIDEDSFTLIRRTQKTEEKPQIENKVVENRTFEENPIREDDSIRKNADERISRLKSMSMSFRNPGQLTELENQPAYLRKNIQLKDPELATQSVVSRHTLGEDNKNNTVIKSDNSFLHDNVD